MGSQPLHFRTPPFVIAQAENHLLASFFLYTEHTVLKNGRAYQTLTTKLYPTADRSLPAGYQGYSSPLKGWVADSGVSGVCVINTVSGGGYSAPLTRASGIRLDYINGRAVVPTSLGTNLVLTGTASYPEFRVYLPNESEEQLLTQDKYFVNPTYYSPLTASGAPPGSYATPAIFINQLSARNDAFSLGGLVDTKSTITVTAFTESNYQLNALFSIFRDMRYNYFPYLDVALDPLNQWGDVKGGSSTGYNYSDYISTYGTPGNLVYISDVRASKVSDRVRANPQLFAGIIDVEVGFVRLPS
jgi:hypothetical protein